VKANIFNIPAGADFIACLCDFLESQEAAHEFRIYLPTRRACRRLKDELAARAEPGKAFLFPQIIPIGDAGEEYDVLEEIGADSKLPPAIPTLERHLLLAHLIKANPNWRGGAAYALARDLAHLLDTIENEELSLADLKSIAPENFARQWQESYQFLSIIADEMPKILDARGYMNPAERKVALIRRAADSFSSSDNVIVAGSTGSMKPISYFISRIAKLPQGFVFLPMLDKNISDTEFANVAADHPQYNLKNLLNAIGVARADVKDFAPAPNADKSKLASMIMKSGKFAADWRAAEIDFANATKDLSIIAAKNQDEEALAISLALANAKACDRSAMLITPDRNLAEKVSNALAAFGIRANDSAGKSALATPLGNYMMLVLSAVRENFSPNTVVPLLRHKFTVLSDKESNADTLEKKILRKKFITRDIEDMIARAPEKLKAFLSDIKSRAAPLRKLIGAPAQIPIAKLLRAHIETMENFSHAEVLYRGDLPSQIARSLNEALQTLENLDDETAWLGADKYADFISDFLAATNARRTDDSDERIVILNSIEARLIKADLTILASLNEGVFPRQTLEDPWFSRAMKHSLGLPMPERKIGLSGHDFVEHFCAPQVLLTHSKNTGDVENIASRWLQKLDAILSINNAKIHSPLVDKITATIKSAKPAPRRKIARPAPCPPLASRPRELSVSAIEKWYQDPYFVYAGKILGLKKLDGFKPELGAADFGNVVHKSLEEAVAAKRTSATEIESIMHRNARDMLDISTHDFWATRFKKISAFVAKYEAENRGDTARTIVEEEGRVRLSPAAFTLHARPDRIDITHQGEAIISDYKTGGIKSAASLRNATAPQLPLEAAILLANGFENAKSQKIKALRYINLRDLKIQDIDEDIDTIIETNLEKLQKFVNMFSNPETPYTARPNARAAKSLTHDYERLEREKEWGQ